MKQQDSFLNLNNLKSLSKVKEAGFTLETITIAKPEDVYPIMLFRFSFPFYVETPDGNTQTVKLMAELKKLEVGWEFAFDTDTFDETPFGKYLGDKGFCMHSTEVEALLEFTKEVDTLIPNIE